MKGITELFHVYLDQLNNRLELSQYRLQQILDEIYDSGNVPSAAIWLWLFMEQVERSNNKKLIDEYQHKLDHIISIIVNQWNQPAPNIWGEDSEDIHISNLGIYYGSLLAVKRITGNEGIQKILTAIRDDVFEQGLSNGMLVRSSKSKEVSTDLLLNVMPFGLFSPEDLVMVEAVKEIENRLVTNESVFRYRGAAFDSPVSAVWLAWYFVEKGDLKKAKHYLKMSEQLTKTTNNDEKELADVFIQIVSYYINELFESDGEIKIVHTPYGNDNPYAFLKTERIPRNPEVNQDVKVLAQLWPEQDNVQVVVKVETTNRQFEVFCSRVKDEDEVVWEASLGSFAFDEEVNYHFFIKKDDKVIKKGEVYTFFPLMFNHLVSVDKYDIKENAFWIEGKDQLNLHSVYLGIFNTNEGVQFIVDFNQDSFDTSIQESNSVKDSISELSYDNQEKAIVIQTDAWACHIEKSPFQLKIVHSSGNSLLQGYDQAYPVLRWLVNKKGDIQQAEWSFKSPLEERFFGFGERFNRFEQRGEQLDSYVYNQYRDQGNRTYMPVPFYISSLDYGLFFETAHYSKFDLGSHFQDLLSISTNLSAYKSYFSFRVFFGKPKEILQQYTKITGKPVLPPTWAFGPWMSSNNWDRDSIVRKQVELTNNYKIPATVLVVEQWSDETTYYIFNDAQYKLKPGNESLNYEEFHFPEWGRWPNPKELTEYLHDNGLKFILWQIPIEKYLNKQQHPQKDEDERVMIEAGYCVKQPDGTPYRLPEGWFKESILMDFSNREGKEWWFNKRKYLLEIGVDGFKTDGGEFVFGSDLQFTDGRTGTEMRNLYPNEYIEAYYRFATDYHGADNALTFSRAGYTGAQNFPAHWAGDERSTFDAFRHSLVAGLTSGISGIPFWGWDLAGFNGDIPTAELFIRSAQMAAFCPIMQYHAESKGEFNQDRTPWNIADRTGDKLALEGYRYFANVRMNLLPYIVDQAKATSKIGIPLMRALFIEYPDDERTYSIYDQYMFGDYLLVAPIIEEGKRERMVYFPQGTWIDVWSNEIMIGPEYKRVKAPLTHIPVYVRSDSAILCNCDDSLQLGSYVGNNIDHYHVAVLRIYPERGMEQIIDDHLNNKWIVKVKLKDNVWHIDVGGYKKPIIMIPVNLIKQEEIIINGKEKTLAECGVQNGYYVIKGDRSEG